VLSQFLGEGRMADVERVIELVRATFPDVIWSQLQVKYPADDDGPGSLPPWSTAREGANRVVERNVPIPDRG
jgi:hypothetical protein